MEAQQSSSSAIQGAGTSVEKILESLPSMIAIVWSDERELQLEATTQFRKLLSVEGSPPIEEVIQSGVVPKFMEFLTRDDYPQLQFQAVTALGNVAGESSEDRDFVLGQEALLPLLQQLNENVKLSILRIATWTLSNFSLELLIHSTDEEVLTDVCWTLFYLSDGTNDKIQVVVDANVCPRLVEILMHHSPSVVIPALRTVGNICNGNDIQTQIIINHQLLPFLLNLLTNNHKESKKDACRTISNITTGNKDQIQAVYLVNQGCIRPLCDLLIYPDPIIVTVCLRDPNILKVGEAEKNLGTTGTNVYAQLIDEAEGLEKIKNLKSHDNTEINNKAMKILETYWMENDLPVWK
ncbi:hypothetical protein MKW92_008241, partial [Papaver armeniacum]